MVKKSFLARLFGRDESEPAPVDAAGRRSVQSRAADSARPQARAESRVTEHTPQEDAPEGVFEEVELEAVAANPPAQHPASGPNLEAMEMSHEEEVALRLQEGFQGINQVLSGLDRKLDQQQKSSDELMVSVRRIPELMKDVPDASRAGLELLATISTVLEQQSRTSQELLNRLQDVPKLMENVEQRLRSETQATAEAAVAAQRAAEQTIGDVRSKVDGLADNYAKRQDELMSELRRQQSESDRRVDLILQKSAGTTKIMIFLVVLAIAAFLLVVNALSGR